MEMFSIQIHSDWLDDLTGCCFSGKVINSCFSVFENKNYLFFYNIYVLNLSIV